MWECPRARMRAQVGAVALLCAPLTPLTRGRAPAAAGTLCLHWCLFKLMYMSGVVKVSRGAARPPRARPDGPAKAIMRTQGAL